MIFELQLHGKGSLTGYTDKLMENFVYVYLSVMIVYDSERRWSNEDRAKSTGIFTEQIYC
jgi:hypothetical protein